MSLRPSRGIAATAIVAGLVGALVVWALVAGSPDDGTGGLAAWQAVVLGLVEGITEYLPISSTGHLLATNTLLGLDETEASEQAIETYAICIQSGAILAVLVLYRTRIEQMTRGLTGRDPVGRRLVVALVAAFVPTAVIALSVGTWVRDQLFSIGPVAAAWLVGGVAILWLRRADFFSREGTPLEEMVVRQAAAVGLAQAVALWPGVSRSLVTIVAAVAVGLTLRAAVEFSFLLGLVTLGAATVVEGLQNGADMIDIFGWRTPLLGLVVAFVSAAVAVRWMVGWLESHGFEIFGWYRISVGIVALVLVGAGAL